MKPVMNAKDIKEYLGVSLSTAYEIMRQTGFPLMKIGGRRLVKSQKFMEWLEKQEEAV
ncbi:helix-turn-helix domain-containing protein [Metabacillus sp. 84]|uniref:helix-turn-helix domain-containing protein n=1 Tax=Metabacillus sp. 84 TaxID=3404705 RepID=UPI003CF1F759